MKALLDTNAYAAMRRGDSALRSIVARSERVLMSAIAVGELMSGFRSGSRFAANLALLEQFLESPFVSFLPVTLTTADRFGRVAAALRAKGRPLPTNDIWIAAHAMESGADLISFDSHFAEIDGIVWTDPTAR